MTKFKLVINQYLFFHLSLNSLPQTFYPSIQTVLYEYRCYACSSNICP